MFLLLYAAAPRKVIVGTKKQIIRYISEKAEGTRPHLIITITLREQRCTALNIRQNQEQEVEKR